MQSYSQKYLEELFREIDQVKVKVASGEQPIFNDVDTLLDKLETD